MIITIPLLLISIGLVILALFIVEKAADKMIQYEQAIRDAANGNSELAKELVKFYEL